MTAQCGRDLVQQIQISTHSAFCTSHDSNDCGAQGPSRVGGGSSSYHYYDEDDGDDDDDHH